MALIGYGSEIGKNDWQWFRRWGGMMPAGCLPMLHAAIASRFRLERRLMPREVKALLVIRQFPASFDQTTFFDQTLRVVPRRCMERRFRRQIRQRMESD